jgi:ankyrin repeat protein
MFTIIRNLSLVLILFFSTSTLTAMHGEKSPAQECGQQQQRDGKDAKRSDLKTVHVDKSKDPEQVFNKEAALEKIRQKYLNNDHLNIFFEAVRRGDFETVETFIKAGIDVNTVDRFPSAKTTALHHAAKGGHKKIIKKLLEHGADPDKCFSRSRERKPEIKYSESAVKSMLGKKYGILRLSPRDINPKLIAECEAELKQERKETTEILESQFKKADPDGELFDPNLVSLILSFNDPKPKSASTSSSNSSKVKKDNDDEDDDTDDGRTEEKPAQAPAAPSSLRRFGGPSAQALDDDQDPDIQQALAASLKNQ